MLIYAVIYVKICKQCNDINMNNRYLDTPDVILPFYEEAARCLNGERLINKKNGYYAYKVTCPKCNKFGSIYLYNMSTNPFSFASHASKINAGAILL